MNDCIFCNVVKDSVIWENDIWVAMLDGYPVTKGHTLLIPKRHCQTIFDLNELESSTLFSALNTVKTILNESYNPNGYNIGANCGEASGQTISHCHIHIIPRYYGDVEDPRGGVRGVISNKQKYA